MSTTLLDYAAAAALLGMSEGALRAAVSRRTVPHVRISDRVVRFSREDLLAWLESRRVPARDARTTTMDAGSQIVELAAAGRGR